jgi:hypothetical protein
VAYQDRNQSLASFAHSWSSPWNSGSHALPTDASAFWMIAPLIAPLLATTERDALRVVRKSIGVNITSISRAKSGTNGIDRLDLIDD